ncbi:MAG: VTC domain-containing protein [Nitrospinales bacterium]
MNNYEQKYNFITQQQQMLLDWLEYCYIQDPNYHFSSVSSIYYDTPTLDLYWEKRNGDYLKSKVRLRWYAKLQELEPNQDVKCYLEVKRKYGAIRNKERLELNISAKQLLVNPFEDDEIISFPSMAYELEYFPQGLLVPTLLIQYERYRFIDPKSSSRIALDINICCKCANEKYVPGIPPIFLSVGVLEIKGEHQEMLNSLTPIADHLTKMSFSKYGRCCESLMQPFELRV